MHWFGNYINEWLRGPWPELFFIRHGHGFHQLAHEMVDKGLAKSPKEALGVDIPNHLVPLTPLGRFQAAQTSINLNVLNVMKQFLPDCVYSSQLTRARQTAETMFPKNIVKIDPRLNEKEFGPAHLMSRDELREYFPLHLERYTLDGKYFAAKAPGGENYVGLYLRVHSILDTLRRDWAGKCVVIICHSAVMLAVRQLFEHYDPEELLRIGEEQWIENCGILHYERGDRLWGFRNGKFRLSLEKPPYKIWDIDEADLAHLLDLSLKELAVLKKLFHSQSESIDERSG